jgi:hypothetical protein
LQVRLLAQLAFFMITLQNTAFKIFFWGTHL